MSDPKPKTNLLGQTSSGKRKANVPSKKVNASVPGKPNTKVTTSGSRPGTVTSESNHTQDKPMQAAVKGGQKYGLPYESGAYKSGSQPADYAKKKKAPARTSSTKTPAKAESKPEAPKRTENKPIKGVSNTGGMLTRTLPSDAIRKGTATKGVDAKKKTYTDKEKKITGVMQKGKKKDGTMKASAQRKISRIRRKK